MNNNTLLNLKVETPNGTLHIKVEKNELNEVVLDIQTPDWEDIVEADPLSGPRVLLNDTLLHHGDWSFSS